MRWIYSIVIEPNLLYGVAFWWTDLDKQQNVKFLDKVRRFALFYVTGALRTTSTKALFAMLYRIPTVLLAKQAAKFAATRLNVQSHTTVMEVDPVTSVNTDYLLAEYCRNKNFHSLIPNREYIHTDGSKLDNEIGSDA